jgi:hypothetical protein
MRKIAVKLATALLLLWPLAFPQDSLALTTQEPEQVVEQFFPQRLIKESEEDFQKGGPAPFRTSESVIADLNGDGSTFIVAAYSNGFAGVIRVLKKENSTFGLVDEPNLRKMGGDFPTIKLLDLDNDGRPEVIASFSSARGPTEDWVFKWDGTKLNLIGPTEVDAFGFIDSLLSDAGFFDVDGDGIIEILNPTGSGPVAPDETENIGKGDLEVYTFDGQKYKLSKSLEFIASFVRQTGAPFVDKAYFEIKNPGAGFLLTVVNGATDGSNKVSSGTIKLNGVVVLSSNDLNQQVRKVVRQVTVLANNVLEVELAGKATGQILVTVEPPVSGVKSLLDSP